MGILLIFAFLSGIITILSPCILPVLPVVLAGGVGGKKFRAIGIVLGFVVSFTVFTLSLTAIVQVSGIPADALRIVAIIVITLFGLILVIPALHQRFMLFLSKILNAGKSRGPAEPGQAKRSTGFIAGIPIGISLGLVWTPCVGPIMASVISLALTQHLDNGAVLITLVYALGTAIPMFAVMLGGRALLNRVPVLLRNTGKIQKVFGVLMILTGIAIGLGWDRQFQAGILRLFPGYGTGLTALENSAPVMEALAKRKELPAGQERAPGNFRNTTPPVNGELGDYGLAPAFVTDGNWYNTGDAAEKNTPLTLEGLRGKVVLIDFWTYSCVNCIRTIPVLKAWYDAYREQGFIIIGVHTPEFEFEKKPSNVQQAIKDLGITWPVVTDNEYAQWDAYANRYWPAHYFIDTTGNVRYFSFGEGRYREAEQVIRTMLGTRAGEGVAVKEPVWNNITPETYLGYIRARSFASAVNPLVDAFADYKAAGLPAEGEWNLEGRWFIAGEYIVPETTGILQLGFTAVKVFLVIEPETPGGRIAVQIDGRNGQDTQDVKNGVLTPGKSRLYQLVVLETPGQHVLRLEVKGKLRLFAFTFE